MGRDVGGREGGEDVRVHGLGVDLLAQLLHLLVDEGGRQLGVKVPDEALVDLVELEGLLPQHGAAVRRDLPPQTGRKSNDRTEKGTEIKK